jgi:hypothetical protein
LSALDITFQREVDEADGGQRGGAERAQRGEASSPSLPAGWRLRHPPVEARSER